MQQDTETLAPSTRAIYAAFDFLSERRNVILLSLAAVAIAAFLANGFYIVKKEERAVKTRFGKVVDWNIPPGIHYAIPLADRTHVRKVARISNRNVATQSESGEVSFSILSGDANLFEANVALQFKINDLGSWLFTTVDPETILTLVVRERLIGIMGRNFIDLIFSNNRDIIQSQLFDEVSAWLDEENIGIVLLTLNIVELRPIEETVAAFRDVNDAIAESIQMVSSATRRSEQLLARSRGQAEAVVLNARAGATERQLQAEASAQAFLDLLDAYRGQSSSVTLTRYWQRMRTILKDATISTVGPGDTAAIDINMIDGFAPGVGRLSGMTSPAPMADAGKDTLFGSRNWLSTEEERVFHSMKNAKRDTLPLFGRTHATPNERHHLGYARPQSLLFDDFSIFGHRDAAQTGVAAAAERDEPPLSSQTPSATDGEGMHMPTTKNVAVTGVGHDESTGNSGEGVVNQAQGAGHEK